LGWRASHCHTSIEPFSVEDDSGCLSTPLALFGFAPSYEHLRIFGCACYPNTAATAAHKHAPSPPGVSYLATPLTTKGYRCLDLCTNRLIVSRHVVFDEDSFPLATSPNLTDLYFLLEYGSTVSTIGTRLPPAGSTTTAACQPAQWFPQAPSHLRLLCLH
jgi:hypothetical protein